MLKRIAGACLISASAAVLSGCAMQAETTAQRWHREWAERSQQYQAEVAKLEGDLSSQWDDFQVTLASASVDEAALSAHLNQLGDTVFLVSKTQAQATVLAGYRGRLQDDPTYGIISSWIADQAQTILDLQERYQTNLELYRARYSAPAADLSNWLGDTEAMVRQGGAIAGGTDEVIRLSREFQSYAREVQQAGQQDEIRRQRLAAALSAMGQQMQQYSHQQQLLYQMQRPRTCNQFGNTITCY